MITLESLLNNDNSSNINECINLEDYSFELSNYTMECSDIMCEINTLEAASIVCEDGENKKNIFKRMIEKIKKFFINLGKWCRTVMNKILSLFKRNKVDNNTKTKILLLDQCIENETDVKKISEKYKSALNKLEYSQKGSTNKNPILLGSPAMRGSKDDDVIERVVDQIINTNIIQDFFEAARYRVAVTGSGSSATLRDVDTGVDAHSMMYINSIVGIKKVIESLPEFDKDDPFVKAAIFAFRYIKNNDEFKNGLSRVSSPYSGDKKYTLSRFIYSNEEWYKDGLKEYEKAVDLMQELSNKAQLAFAKIVTTDGNIENADAYQFLTDSILWISEFQRALMNESSARLKMIKLINSLV